MTKSIIATGALLAALAVAGSANANGCNGVVSQFEWGCAAWDHNNGPQYPHYKAPVAAAPARTVVARPSYSYAQPRSLPQVVRPAGGGQLVGPSGGTFVGQNGSAVVSNDGGSMTSH